MMGKLGFETETKVGCVGKEMGKEDENEQLARTASTRK